MQNQRVSRLVRLREQQHLLTAMHLQTARHGLRLEDDALAAAQQGAQSARDSLRHAQQSGEAQIWLLACAEADLCNLAATRHGSRRVTAKQAVQEAAQHEAAARMASKQMEHAFKNTLLAEKCAESRAEQLRLDEIALNLKAFTRSARRSGSLV